MPKALDLWERRYLSLRRTFEVGQKSLDFDAGYVYRVANIYFEAAFALLLLEPQSNWKDWLIKAVEYFRKSIESGDCQNRPDFPLNMARLCQEWYLALWLLESEPKIALLEQSILLYTDGLWGGQRGQTYSLPTYSALPMVYMLKQDRSMLTEFWKKLGDKYKLDTKMPAELDLFRRWTDIYLSESQPSQSTRSGFIIAYSTYSRQEKDPTVQPARFYISAARIGIENFGVTGTPGAVLTRLAVTPWG